MEDIGAIDLGLHALGLLLFGQVLHPVEGEGYDRALLLLASRATERTWG